MLLTDAFIQSVVGLAQQAGLAIHNVYHLPVTEQGIEYKKDDSPLTEADRQAHAIIEAGLHALTPQWPLISEESASLPYEQRQQWRRYWLVDPLDGTKDFIARTGEFTVNIALIENGEPIFGVIDAPHLKVSYWGAEGRGAFKQSNGLTEAVHAKPLGTSVRVLGSRHHASQGPDLSSLGPLEHKAVGSSLKFCWLAEGLADLYVRLGPTSEWDTAAGQAILQASGGVMCDIQGLPIRYNQKPEMVQPYFVAIADKEYLSKVLSLLK